MEKADLILAKLEKLERMASLTTKNVLNVEDAAELTGLSKSRIYVLCQKNMIPHYKQGKTYFKRKEVEDWMTAHYMPTKQETERV
jgi:excisionase family DNA binding protein